MKTILLITIALFNISTITAQFIPEWVQTHSTDCYIWEQYIDQSNNFYIAGSRYDQAHGSDVILIKYNSSGNLVWSRLFNNPGPNTNDYPFAIFADNAGYVYAFANCQGGGFNSVEVVMIKYDGSGNFIDSYTYQHPGYTGTRAQDVEYINNTDFAVTGYVISGVTDSIFTFKMNKNGVVSWVKTISGTGLSSDYANDISTDASGNIYITGELINSNFKFDAVTVKYNSAGVLQWTQNYGSGNNFNEKGMRIAIDNSQNVYVAGYVSIVSGDDSSQTFVVRYNSSGQQQWANNYNISNSGIEIPNKILVSSNDIYIPVSAANEKRLFKVNSSGAQEWVFNYQNTPIYIAFNSSNKLIISGTQTGYFRKMLSFQQINPAGGVDLAYKYNYTTTGNDAGGYFKDHGNGNYSIVGTHDTLLMLLKLNPAQFASNTVSSSRSGLNKPILDNQTIYDTITFNLDALPPNTYISAVNLNIDSILHTSTGDLEISLLHNGQNDTLIYRRGGFFDNFIGTKLVDTATQFMCGAGNNPFTGYYSPCKPFSQLNNFTATGPWILKIYDRRSPDTGVLKSWSLNVTYQTLIGLTQVSSQAPKTYLLSQNYPNPFNPVTKIKFSIPRSSQVKIIIYDLTGREVKTLVDQNLNPGEYETDFDGSELSSGVYFYKFISEEFAETRKMVLIK